MTNPELLSQSLTPDFLRNQSHLREHPNDHPSQWEPYSYTVEDQEMLELRSQEEIDH